MEKETANKQVAVQIHMKPPDGLQLPTVAVSSDSPPDRRFTTTSTSAASGALPVSGMFLILISYEIDRLATSTELACVSARMPSSE